MSEGPSPRVVNAGVPSLRPLVTLGGLGSFGMPFLLVDSELYVRGDARHKLRLEAEQNGFPIVAPAELTSIYKIASARLI